MDYFNPNPYGFLSPAEVAHTVEGRTSDGTHVNVYAPIETGPSSGPAPLDLPQRELMPLEDRGYIYQGRTPGGSHVDMSPPLEEPHIQDMFGDPPRRKKGFCYEPDYTRKKLFGDKDPFDFDLSNPFRKRNPFDF